MKRKTIIIVVCILIAAALLIAALPHSDIKIEGVIVSVTVTEKSSGENEIIICMTENGESTDVYVRITNTAKVVDNAGKKVAAEYLREGDFISVTFAKSQKNARIKDVKKVMFDVRR